MMKKNLIRICIVMIVVSIFSFSDWSFAVEDSSDVVDEFGQMLYLIISMLSWLWVFFAKGAGEFLTNKWVYGEILGLDVILWKYRNVVKNFANFGLGFYFLYTVFKGLINSKKDVIQSMKNVILWLLIAGVGIQTSRFLTAVVIDTSTVTLAAAGSLPSLMASGDGKMESAIDVTLDDYFNEGKKIYNKYEMGKLISLYSSDGKMSNVISVTNMPLSGSLSKKELFDNVMPNAENVSGPLYYLGFSILRTTKIISPNASNEGGWKSTIFNLILQGGTTIIYSIEMLVLLVVAVMRMVYMWMFIVLSPMVILLWCIKQCNGKGGKGSGTFGKSMEAFQKQINFSSFFWNAFKPSLIVLGFSVAMMFVTLMSGVIIDNGTKKVDVEGMTIYKHCGGSVGSSEGDQKCITSIDGESAGLVIRSAGKTIFELLLCIITVVLVYIILKETANMGGGDFVTNKIKKLNEAIEWGIGTIPVMPVAGYDKDGKPTTRYLGAGKVFGIGEGNKSIISAKIGDYQQKVNNNINEQSDIVRSWFGDESGYLLAEEVRVIENAGLDGGIPGLKAKKNAIVKSEEGKGMKLNPNTAQNNGFWIHEFEKWLEKSKEQTISGTGNDAAWRNMIEWWNDGENKEQGLENMFKNNKSGETASVKAYADFFGLKLHKYDWDHLKDADISQSD